jgi:hypothetical protein
LFAKARRCPRSIARSSSGAIAENFFDPAFAARATWTAYHDYHKSPRTRRAGEGFADPDQPPPIEWLDA